MFPCLVLGVGAGAIGIACTFFEGFVVERFQNVETRGDHRQKKFFMNNSVESLVSFNEELRSLLNCRFTWGGSGSRGL